MNFYRNKRSSRTSLNQRGLVKVAARQRSQNYYTYAEKIQGYKKMRRQFDALKRLKII
jgi:hypothetical protein